jgi:cysteine-rich repeat protein
MRHVKTVLMGLMIAMTGLAGCSGDNDRPPIEPEPEPEPPPPYDGITGRWYTKCYQAEGVVEHPTDLRATVVQALIPDDSASGYRVIAGEGKEDGTFKVPGVPAGASYLLRLDDLYYETDQRVLNAFVESWGRCSPAPSVSNAETRVTFNLTNMTPFTANSGQLLPSDQLEVETSTGFSSLNQIYESSGEGGGVAIGDESLNATIDWNQEFIKSLPSAAYQDELRVLHRRNTPVRDEHQRRVTIESLVSIFRTASVTLQSGVAAVVSGAFTRLPQDRRLSFSVDRSMFASGDPLVDRLRFSVEIVTGDGQRVMTASLQDVSRSASPVSTLADLAYADPFPAPEQRSSIITARGARWYHVPGTPTTSGQGVSVSNVQVRPFPGAIGPGSSFRAPGNVRIAGGDFALGGKLSFNGQAPVSLQWDPVPTASYYTIVAQLVDSELTVLHTFRTAGTSLKLPASAFEPERFYVFSVRAYRAANDYAKGELFLSGLTDRADVASGRLRFTSQCGDGVVQAGEACDTSGESATCNVDCTEPLCGDGLRNAAAGESCDSRNGSPGCDESCTLVVCGDGEVNADLEDCDDGNATDDGNGCSATCKYDNVCGNGVVESTVEFCDQGGVDTATCNATCTRSFCGDGYRNAAAGEECDDGLYRSRCSAQCTLLP